ncbi:MAG: DUF4373 domain-containing protein, partial [Ezakiella sp.]|nr:DUF4373 domain-containing protein [Ezakiella sp.]
MSDNNQRYFSHDDNARNDPKMIEARMTHGNIAHGIYFMIIELLRQAPDFMIESDPRKIAFQLNEPDVELVRSIVKDFDFFDFYTDEETGKEFITSQSLLNRMEMMKNNSLSDKRKNAAHARWKKKNELANGNSKEGETVNNENQSKDISIDDKKDKNTTIGNSNEVYRLDLSEKEVEEVKKQNKCKTMQVECKPYAKGMQNEFACMQNSFASMQNEFASCKPYA